ncbi:MAG TPA: glycosyltransferase N-terminal domain-containing protein, partial [Pseudomonadales bacterium]|nr:glycosyltransferase N-terminal domain-containing protein [Pseudomonadales bacterium]
MARLLYTVLFYLSLPLFILHLISRGQKAPAYLQRWGERFALNGIELNRCIWVHAVSMGEVIASIPLVEKLLLHYPALPVLITTMTPTGSERVKAAFGDRVHHVYCPYDLPGPINRFLDAVNPQMLIIMETELWPNLLHYTARRAIPIVLANARLSARSAKGYQRVRWLTRPMLEKLNIVAAQAQPDGDRFLSLGLDKSHLAIT